ncbi:MAG: right-handed parallel beta-helix repeat-containing protein [bacterium]
MMIRNRTVANEPSACRSHRTRRTYRLLSWLCLLGFLLPFTSAFGAKVVLRPDGSGAFSTIQAAIDNANDGDIIELTPGTYTGDGNRDLDCLGKAITITADGAERQAYIIDCAGGDWDRAHRAFHFHSGEGSQTLISGLTIQHGRAPGDSLPEKRGGAVLCAGSSPTFRHCVFSLNRATLGGAIACIEGASPTFQDCQLRDNTAAQGGAVFSHESTPRIVACHISLNTADRGGGLACYASAAVIESSTLYRNSATGGGGVMLEAESAARIEDCLLCGNHAELGGAIFGEYSAPTISYCTLVANSAGSGGGINWISDRGLILQNCIIAYSSQGSAVICESDTGSALTCCLVYGNADGDWIDCLAGLETGSGNLHTPPQFINAGRGNFKLRPDSPCRAENSTCGQIGAQDPDLYR